MIQSKMKPQEKTCGEEMTDLSHLMSVLPDGHLIQAILRSCENLEQAIKDDNKSYTTKLEILMSLLENLLTDCLTRMSPTITSVLFHYLLKNTLFLVFHGDLGDNKAIRSHLLSLFNRFKIRAQKKKLDEIVDKVNYLMELIENDPWGNRIMKIINGKNESKDQIFHFVKQELGIFLRIRLKVMICAGCYTQALALVEKCIDCVSNPLHSVHFEPFSDEILHLKDLLIILLNTVNSDSCINGKIYSEIHKMGLEGCVEFFKRCHYEKLPFGKLTKKAADVVLNMALTSAIMKEDTDENVLQQLLDLWFFSLTDSQVLFRLLEHLVKNAICSQYIYAFAKMLTKRFKLTQKELCVEVYARALNLNVNEIEYCRTNFDRNKIGKYKVQLSNGLLELADYLHMDVPLHREIVLTAFSVNPSTDCLERINALGREICDFHVENIGNEQLISIRGEHPLSYTEKGQGNKLEPCEHNEAQWVVPRHDVSKENEKFTEEIPPYFSATEPPTSNMVSHDGASEFNIQTKHVLEHSYQQDQIQSEIENLNESDFSEGITHSRLSPQLSNLHLQDKDHHNINMGDEQKKQKVALRCVQNKYAYNAETIKISQILCDDVSTLVSYSRNKELTWDLPFPELKQRCETYILEVKQDKLFEFENLDFNTSSAEMGILTSHEGTKMNTDDHGFKATSSMPLKPSKKKRKRL